MANNDATPRLPDSPEEAADVLHTQPGMTVVLSTIGKFHSFDLARQLHQRKVLKQIFSGYPAFKLKNERLPKNKVRTFPWIHAPYMRLPLHRMGLQVFWERLNAISFDNYVARHLPPCDLFCGLSGTALHSGRTAQLRGAKYVCDRGSAHIRFQDSVLREEYDRQGISFPRIDPRVIAREEAEYETADAITVPSTYALNSFLQFGVSRQKLRLVPYGVDLSTFHPTRAPSNKQFHVLFVGCVSVRKGIAYLLNAFEKIHHGRKHLTIVGTIEPKLAPLLNSLRNRSDISVTGHVPQTKLKDLLSASNVMVLPSVDEGLALVQAQAMACGCPVIASEHTGASDLFTSGVEGFIVPIRNSDAIAERLQQLADHPELRAQMSRASLERVKALGGWDAYGATMYGVFEEILGRRNMEKEHGSESPYSLKNSSKSKS